MRSIRPGVPAVNKDALRAYIAENYRPVPDDAVFDAPSFFAGPSEAAADAAVPAEPCEELFEEAESAGAHKPFKMRCRASEKRVFATPCINASALPQAAAGGVLDPRLGESFPDMLMRLIDERGLRDPQVYRAANVSRAAFCSIKNGVTKNPSRQTVVGLALALHLDWDQSVKLMGAAGLAFSDNSLFDVIAAFCIKNGIYDVYEANCLMTEYDQPLIGRQ